MLSVSWHIPEDYWVPSLLNHSIGRVCQLLAAGVSVNFQDSPTSLNTPLHWAASFGNKDAVQCLCKRGAHVNLQNIHGATPLHDAVNRGDPNVVRELLIHGASAEIQAGSGAFANKTPLDLAKGKPSIMQVFDKTSQGEILLNGQGADNEIVNPSGEGSCISWCFTLNVMQSIYHASSRALFRTAGCYFIFQSVLTYIETMFKISQPHNQCWYRYWFIKLFFQHWLLFYWF